MTVREALADAVSKCPKCDGTGRIETSQWAATESRRCPTCAPWRAALAQPESPTTPPVSDCVCPPLAEAKQEKP
jgi:hypothetical protein